MHEIVNALKFLLKSLAEWLFSNALLMRYFKVPPAVASFKALGNSRLRFGALHYKVPKVDLVH
ncbi:hypothetical protein ID0607_13360 [Helicobacter pylori]|nr:hypothetical protein KVE51_05225 [Helicobacter pylori]